ncbi:MAG: glycosyltransferase, partial [Anaerolineae bacterium]|nr:glycosyltransferase [Anaerolineae bacterium]
DGGPALPEVPEAWLPSVTVQVPLRNERHVATQVIGAVSALDWPRDRLEIQILDDSDDETSVLVASEVLRYRSTGLNMQMVRRSDPAGYKAGALAAGLASARGEFVAIFDADFCPDPAFLRETVPYFSADARLGMVQARWSHLNAEYSLITRVQALALDAHFAIEHLARNRSGLLMNFNGAGGVWRRAVIEEAGGWCPDTLTEDLDLSYRAQLAGWRALYLPDVVAPAELTPLLAALKAQQARWAKGASQCLRKLAGPLLRSRRLTWAQKVMALLHLSGYFNQPLLLVMILLTLPMVLTDPHFPDFSLWLGTLAAVPPLLYVLGQMHLYRDWLGRILVYPALMLLWVGLTLSLTVALVDGLWHWGGSFVRTPKYRIRGRTGRWQTSSYRPRTSRLWMGELALGVYVCVAIWMALRLDHGHLIPLVMGYALGQIMILAVTLVQALAARRGRIKEDR